MDRKQNQAEQGDQTGNQQPEPNPGQLSEGEVQQVDPADTPTN